MSIPELKERVSLVEQRQEFMEDTVVKHMANEDKRNEETKAIQGKIFDKIEVMQQSVMQNTIDNNTGVKSIKSTIIIVGSVLGMIFGGIGVALAFARWLS